MFNFNKIFMITALFTALFYLTTQAQAPDILWTKTYGGSKDDIAFCVKRTPDGGYIVGGKTNSYGAGNNDFWLMKLDANGDSLWARTYGGSEHDEAYNLALTSDGGYILTGYTKSFSISNEDIWIVKTDANGDTMWTRTIIGPYTSSDIGFEVIQTTDGGYLVVGQITGIYMDVCLIKLDATGKIEWIKDTKKNLFDFGYSVVETADGGFLITGMLSGFNNPFNQQVLLMKTNANGDTLWFKNYGGTGNEHGKCIRPVSEGGYIIAGYNSTPPAFLNDVWLLRIDDNGDTLWTKRFHQENDGQEYGYKVMEVEKGFIIVGTGYPFGGKRDGLIIRTDLAGNVLWSKTVGGDEIDEVFSVAKTDDGGYLIGGQTYSSGHGGADAWLIRIAKDQAVPIESTITNIIDDFQLFPNYPNPFNTTTTISYKLPANSHVSLIIYDATGKKIKTLLQKFQTANAYTIKWNGTDDLGRVVGSGVYYYQLKVRNSNDSFVQTKKMILLK